MSDLPKIAQQRLREAAASHSDKNAHPDADLLTAFVEQNLAAQERDNVMQHLAMCAECREVVAGSLPSLDGTEAIPAQSAPLWLRWKLMPFGLGTALAAVII